MLAVTRYRFKPHMTKAEMSEMMALFAEVGEAPGTVSHYVDASGGGGFIIGEVDDVEGNYANTVRYAPYLTLETTIVLPIEAAVPHVLNALS